MAVTKSDQLACERCNRALPGDEDQWKHCWRCAARSFALLMVGAVASILLWAQLEGADPGAVTRAAVALAIGLPVIVAVTTLVHELGHAIAGLLLGFDVRSVLVGQGPRLIALRSGGVKWELRLVPSNGFTTAYLLSPRAWGLRWTGFLLAGPAVTALATAGIGIWHPRDTPITAALFVGWMVMGGLMLAATGLPLPHSGRFDNDIVGASVERARSEHEIEAVIAADGAGLVYEMADSGDTTGALALAEQLSQALPNSNDVEAVLIYALSSSGRVAEARQRLAILMTEIGEGDDLLEWVASMEDHLG